MVIATLARKDLRLLLRDPRALVILLVMPLIFIAALGASLGEGFGKTTSGLRVSVVIEDEGPPRHFDVPSIVREGMGVVGSAGTSPLTAVGFAEANGRAWFPRDRWADRVLADIGETADIHVEIIPTRAEAKALVDSGKRAAVLVFGPKFSKCVARCSFLSPGWKDGLTAASAFPHSGDPIALMGRGLYDDSQRALPLYVFDGLNPFHREGVNVEMLDVKMLRDPTQLMDAAIIDQVAQGSLLRVIMPWMIGRAFEKIRDPQFLALLGNEPNMPAHIKLFLTNPLVPQQQRTDLSNSLKGALQRLFPRYDLTAKTWTALTRSRESTAFGAAAMPYKEDGAGAMRRGAFRYQILVPLFLVMFAFFLVLSVGWLIVAERRQGTLKRLSLAPISRIEILIGKLLPCLLMSWFQGAAIFVAGKLIFGMSWGPNPLWLVAVVMSTSFAAMGLALWVAALAKTEAQVAIYGTLLVLVLAFVSIGAIFDRSLMPEAIRQISRLTPQTWALDAYRQLLTNPTPNLTIVAEACGVLVAFGCGFLTLAWMSLRWD